MDEKVVAYDENGKPIAGKYSWENNNPWYKRVFTTVKDFVCDHADDILEWALYTFAAYSGYKLGKASRLEHNAETYIKFGEMYEKEKAEAVDDHLKKIMPNSSEIYAVSRNDEFDTYSEPIYDFISRNYTLTKKEEQ